MSSASLTVFYVAVAILLAGILIPGRDTARRPKRAVKRRIYLTARSVFVEAGSRVSTRTRR